MSGSTDRRGLAAAIERASERELRRYELRTEKSRRLAERAGRSLRGGVASDFHRVSPWPIHLERGDGARVVDVDGAVRVDFHNGFGATVHGHADPRVAAVVRERYEAGSQFGAPSEDAVAVAEELTRRWGLPEWRFASSGTEAVTDAIRAARGATGRTTVVKAIGGFHGVGVAEGAGVEAVPFNDATSLERLLAGLKREDRPAACVILEPALMLGCVLPEPGYLAAVGSIVAEDGGLLIFDEAKTGLAIAAGGASERFGARPDLVVVAKALGGGLPAAALGGSERAMAAIGAGEVAQAGTFNGNPLSMAAGRCVLTELLTPPAYERLEHTSARLAERLAAHCGSAAIEAHAVGLGARGALAFAPGPVRDADAADRARAPRFERLLWLFAVNRGLYLTPARPLSWTVSVAHGEPEVEAYASVWAELLDDLRLSTPTSPLAAAALR